jgi:hypothetical protein
MGPVEGYLLKTFGVSAVNFFRKKGAELLNRWSATPKARQLLHEFLSDIGAEDRIDEYLAKLEALNDPTNPVVKSVREVISRTTVKRKTSYRGVTKKKMAKKRTTKVCKKKTSTRAKRKPHPKVRRTK